MQRRAFPDLFIHQRLGEKWFVTFIVAMTAVADDLDDDIFTELLSIIHCQFCSVNSCFGILTVDMEDRHHEHLGFHFFI